ncbi:class I SAM-dependent methyltransferase [Candidatus Woesearchaeota archaeon]|nr:class I SAM-dependent methyltransferase [Candidatus Woesearchaeota archaeon]
MRIDPRSIYRKIFPSYGKELEKAVGSCKTLLDIGCGENSPIKQFSHRPASAKQIGLSPIAHSAHRGIEPMRRGSEAASIYSVGVDASLPSIQKSKKESIHNRYFRANVMNIGERFKPDSFDCVLASDLIEHLTKTEGLKLLGMMEKIASVKVIVFTPNGFLPQQGYDNNPFQLHKSGWTVDEMKKLGYHVIGINGWKPLRGEQASIKLRPKLFWQIISDLTQLLTRNRPEKAFQILCVKSVN